MDLHSTMVLLKYLYTSPNWLPLQYLHSTMVLLKSYAWNSFIDFQNYLHSTMVLLKCVVFVGGNVAAHKSTFHYGSIKISRRRVWFIKWSKSTFHYGSIKIQV